MFLAEVAPQTKMQSQERTALGRDLRVVIKRSEGRKGPGARLTTGKLGGLLNAGLRRGDPHKKEGPGRGGRHCLDLRCPAAMFRMSQEGDFIDHNKYF